MTILLIVLGVLGMMCVGAWRTIERRTIRIRAFAHPPNIDTGTLRPSILLENQYLEALDNMPSAYRRRLYQGEWVASDGIEQPTPYDPRAHRLHHWPEKINGYPWESLPSDDN